MFKNFWFRLIILTLAVVSIGSFFFLEKNLEQEKSKKIAILDFNKFPVEAVSENSVRILFVGDLMFDRYIRQKAGDKGNDFIFSRIKNMLLENDLVVANLEGPITEKNSVSVGTFPGDPGHFSFTFPKSLATTLYSHNIRLVNLGNNHILNKGAEGYAETEKYLEESKVEYFGDVSGQNQFLIKNINGTKIGFVNYNQFEKNSSARALEKIRKIRNQIDFLVIYTYWGIEYETVAKENVKKLAHEFVDNGADLIIGTHPYVVEPSEIYNGKKIYYSPGNFVFDQYFSPETKKGLGISVRITMPDKKIEFRDINLTLDSNGQTRADEL